MEKMSKKEHIKELGIQIMQRDIAVLDLAEIVNNLIDTVADLQDRAESQTKEIEVISRKLENIRNNIKG